MSDNSADWLNEIFNIPTDGSNITNVGGEEDVQDNAYAEIGKGVYTDSYEDKVSVLKKTIEPSKESEEYDFVEEPKKEEPKKEEPKKEEPKKEQTIQSKESKSNEEKVAEYQEQQIKDAETETSEHNDSDQVVHQQAVDSKNADDEENEESQNEIRDTFDISNVGDSSLEGWVLSSSSPKFNKFYEHKVSKINRLRSIGFIPFEKYQEELKQAFVPIWNPTDDTSVVNEKIKAISDWRNRVTQITLEVDPQLSWWSMVVEHLQGLLALTQYEKPKERQTGMHYIHLRDVEDYLSRLKGIKSNCTSVMNNLDKAYDSLSRQITVIMPQKELEKYQNSNSTNYGIPFNVNKSPAQKALLEEYDSLNNVENVMKTSKRTIEVESKTGKVSWNDIRKK